MYDLAPFPKDKNSLTAGLEHLKQAFPEVDVSVPSDRKGTYVSACRQIEGTKTYYAYANTGEPVVMAFTRLTGNMVQDKMMPAPFGFHAEWQIGTGLDELMAAARLAFPNSTIDIGFDETGGWAAGHDNTVSRYVTIEANFCNTMAEALRTFLLHNFNLSE